MTWLFGQFTLVAGLNFISKYCFYIGHAGRWILPWGVCMGFRTKAGLFSAFLVLAATGASAAETISLQALKAENNFAPTTRFAGANSLTSLFALDSKNTFAAVRTSGSKSGATMRFNQYFDGLRVLEHSAVVVTDNAGRITNLHGYVAQGIEVDLPSTAVAVTENTAIAAVKAAHQSLYQGATSWKYSDISVEKGIFITNSGEAVVVYNVQFFADSAQDQLPSRPSVMVDANTGKIVSYRDELAFNAAQATGPGGNAKTGQYHYGTDFPALEVNSDDSNNCHFSTTNVKTIDLKNEGTGNPRNDGKLNTTPHSFTCSENTSRPINGAFSPLNDAHFFGTGVFNMYQSWYGVNPLKSDLTLRVHYGKSFENAFWDGKQMTFGDGKDMFYPLVVLDVTAHEVSHGFTEFNSKLVYTSQSGGINEAFSDIAGEAAEFFMRGSNDFMVGAEIGKSMDALRYMDDPTRDGISIKHVSDFREPKDQFKCLICKLGGGGRACADMCGTDVHHSSGIYNKVFHDVAKSAGWDVRKTFDVFVKANQSYWTEQTNFKDGAVGLVDAAKELGYSTEEFKRAFSTVGINL